MSSTQPTHATHGDGSAGCSFGPMLSAYLDGELTSAQQETFERHLPSCGTCNAELTDLRRFSQTFDSAAVPPLMMDRREAILDAVFSRGDRRSQPVHLWYVRRISAVAAAVFLLAMGQMVYRQVKAPQPTDNPTVTPTNLTSPAPQVDKPKTPPSTLPN